MSNAAVSIENTGTSLTTRTTTTNSGFYTVTNLIPGEYTVRVEAPGFRQFLTTGIRLSVDTGVRIDCPLAIGSTSETVNVSAEAALLKTEKADVSAVLETRTVAELPTLNRNVSTLVSILPGAIRGGTAFVGENPAADSNGFVNGLGSGNNYHQLDGIDNQETIQGVAMINPAIDSLEEVKITTNSYDAEFGQVAGAIFQVSTKSGTNAFHGSLFEYLQNDKFFARNPYTQSTSNVAPWRWNQFGGSLAGPSAKRNCFSSRTARGLRSRNGSTIVMGVPTRGEARRRLQRPRHPSIPIFDPQTGDANGRGRTQFPNNIIPANRLDPITEANQRSSCRTQTLRTPTLYHPELPNRVRLFPTRMPRRTCGLQPESENPHVRTLHVSALHI